MRGLWMAVMLAAVVWSASAQTEEEYYTRYVVFPPNATLEQKVEMAARLVPTEQQLAWQQLELTAFLHFGINTFTDREWGDGKEDPSLFNPTAFDARQWVRTLSEAGFRMVILTAKHHDGFCLWPTATTRHSVASSPWRNGRGDVVQEVREACREYGMRFGVYLSPWDRHASCYGDSPKYNRYFLAQLTELLTHYGDIDEVWFDGACAEGPNGRRQEYDWGAYVSTINCMQPRAVTAIMGDDVRWVGNEKGLGRETEWSATVLTPAMYDRAAAERSRMGLEDHSPDLGSRAMLEQATELFWYPSEVDVSIRPGWFYHAAEDGRVKSLKELVDIYFESVGMNSVLLLNVPPDQRGLIHEADSTRLRRWADYLRRAFAHDRVLPTATPTIIEENRTVEYTLEGTTPVNIICLQEDISKGQRVESFCVEARVDGGWQEIARGTTIGYKRLLRFPTVEADAIRLHIEASRGPVHLSRVSAFHADPPEQAENSYTHNDLPRDTWRQISDAPLVIDLGHAVRLRGITYAPADGVYKQTTAWRYSLELSADGVQWYSVVADGEFANIKNHPIPQTVATGSPTEARYIRLNARSADGNHAVVSLEEIGVLIAD